MPKFQDAQMKKQIRFTFWNYLLLSWLTPLFIKGGLSTRVLHLEDVYELPVEYQAHHLVAHHRMDTRISSLVNKYWSQLLLGGLAIATSSGFSLASPKFLEYLIKYMETFDVNTNPFGLDGLKLAFLLFGLQIGNVLFKSLAMQIFWSVASKIYTTLVAFVYKKGFSLSYKSSIDYQPSKVMNLVSIDIPRITMFLERSGNLIRCPLEIITAFILIQNYVGYGMWGAVGVIIASFVAIGLTLRKLGVGMKNHTELSDDRLQIIREMLQNMKTVKIQALETYFLQKISQVRSLQLQHLKTFIIFRTIIYGVFQQLPILMPYVCIMIYFHLTQNLNADTIFPTLVLLKSLSGPLSELPQTISNLISAIVSAKRIDEFSNAEELQATEELVGNGALVVCDAEFRWDTESSECGKQEGFTLNHININVDAGNHVAIVGDVGAGKSSLLLAILEQMPRKSGRASFSGRAAFSNQIPCILSDSITNNILFFKELDQQRLDAVIEACALDKDMDMFPAGLDTRIGERGLNLSGGQRARIDLARALYSDADIYFLDDPFSALDAHVGNYVFEKAIKGFLKDKTVILVTHQIRFLPLFDHIILMKDGEIIQQGSYPEFDHLEATDQIKSIADEEHTKTSSIETKEDKLIVDEDREVGSVSKQVIWEYIKKCGGVTFLAITITVFTAFNALDIVANLYLSLWISSSGREGQLWYGVFTLIESIIAFASASSVFIGTFYACKYYHDQPLSSLLQAPLFVFETQPVGRFLNRLTADCGSVDLNLPMDLGMFLYAVGVGISSLVFLSVVDVRMLAVVIPMFLLFSLLMNFYQKTNIELKRLSSIAKSPLLAYINESLSNKPTILAYRNQHEFTKHIHKLIDESCACDSVLYLGKVWISIRLQLLSRSLILAISLLGLISKNGSVIFGLSLLYAMGASQAIGVILSSLSALEASFNSVERLSHYIDHVPKEADSDDFLPAQWPTAGHIVFQNVRFAYPVRPERIVLDDISFSIEPGQKIGIVGRTGSGKSSLITALLRLGGLDSGKIEIDGVDISLLPLKTLREAIEVVQQEPVLFNGTIRDNVDLELKHKDDEIWRILEIVGLKIFVSSLPQKLQHPITGAGHNISVGQRQLICLARAILKKKKLLILDEATASVDPFSDELIQKTIQEQFQNTTILNIAHRLTTIKDFDKALVLSEGRLMEFDTIAHLKEKQGMFAKLFHASLGNKS
jgi:ABC-type multidrug transport system fused ATPase/permease subunit